MVSDGLTQMRNSYASKASKPQTLQKPQTLRKSQTLQKSPSQPPPRDSAERSARVGYLDRRLGCRRTPKPMSRRPRRISPRRNPPTFVAPFELSATNPALPGGRDEKRSARAPAYAAHRGALVSLEFCSSALAWKPLQTKRDDPAAFGSCGPWGLVDASPAVRDLIIPAPRRSKTNTFVNFRAGSEETEEWRKQRAPRKSNMCKSARGT